ncbi:Transcription factor IIIA, partial [Lobosporangium transversale]
MSSSSSSELDLSISHRSISSGTDIDTIDIDIDSYNPVKKKRKIVPENNNDNLVKETVDAVSTTATSLTPLSTNKLSQYNSLVNDDNYDGKTTIVSTTTTITSEHHSFKRRNPDNETSIQIQNEDEKVTISDQEPVHEVTSHRSSISSKMSSSSKAKQYICLYSGCGKKYTKPSRLAAHERSHTDERPYRCLYTGCNAAFRREDHLAVHVKSHGSIREFQCINPGCTKSYYTKDKLARHVKTHNELASLSSIEICTAFLSTPSSPVQSLSSETPPSETPPSETSSSALTPMPELRRSRSSSSLPTLVSSINSDNEDLNIKSGAKRGYRREASLDPETLMKVAEEIKKEKPYACTWDGCQMRFKKHKKLSAHVCTDHEGRKPYPCLHEGCQMSFQTPSKLQKHQLVHNDTRRYGCGYPECNSVFSKWSLLQKHNKMYHKSMPCSVCGTVVLKTNMRSHMKTHDPNRPVIPCTFEGCSKIFSTAWTLTSHIKTTHEKDLNAPKFRCEFEGCGKEFGYKHVLNKHINRKHTSPSLMRKKRSDAIQATALDELFGFTEEDAQVKLPFACVIPGCHRRYHREDLLRRHLNSSEHQKGKLTGIQVLQSMEQVENQTIQEMISLHIDNQIQDG